MFLFTSVTSCCSSMDVGHTRAVTSSHCRQMIKDGMNSYNKKKKIRSRMKLELSTNACSVNMVSLFCKASHSGCHFTVCSAYEVARYSTRAGLRATSLCHRILPSFPRNTIFITTTKADCLYNCCSWLCYVSLAPKMKSSMHLFCFFTSMFLCYAVFFVVFFLN